MRRRIEKDDWSYIYEDTQKCIYEFTSVRYVLGRKIDKSKTKALICIGINPSTAIPTLLDPTLSRVQKYAQNCGEYNAWYMINVYPQRATNFNDVDTDKNYQMVLHLTNIDSIKNLLESVKCADVWCAWGSHIANGKRRFLHDLLVGNQKKNIQGIMRLFQGDYTFKAYKITKSGFPAHPLLMRKNDKLQEVKLEKILCNNTR